MSPWVWAGLAGAGGLGALARFTVDARVSAAVARRRGARTGRKSYINPLRLLTSTVIRLKPTR